MSFAQRRRWLLRSLYRRGKSWASEADEDAEDEDPEEEDPPVLVLPLLPLEGGAEEDEEDAEEDEEEGGAEVEEEGGAEVVGGAEEDEEEGGAEVVGGAKATRGSYSTTAKLFLTAIGSVSFIVPLPLKQAAEARADTRRKRTRIVILRVCEKDLGRRTDAIVAIVAIVRGLVPALARLVFLRLVFLCVVALRLMRRRFLSSKTKKTKKPRYLVFEEDCAENSSYQRENRHHYTGVHICREGHYANKNDSADDPFDKIPSLLCGVYRCFCGFF